MNKLLILSLLFIVLSLSLRTAQAAVSVNFRDEVTVYGPEIRLGDIAEVSGPESLRGMKVAQAPLPGATLELQSEGLCRRIARSQSPRLEMLCESKIVRVLGVGVRMEESKLQAEISKALEGKLPEEGEWEASLLPLPRDIIIPREPHSLQVHFPDGIRGGRRRVEIRVMLDGSPVANWTAWVNLRRYEEVWMASRKIARGETLGPHNLELRRVETTYVHSSLNASVDPKSATARQIIKPGRTLSANLVEWPPLVRRGETVSLVVTHGLVEVTAEAVVKQDGAAGEIVMAQNKANRRLMRARVLDDGTLRPLNATH